MSDYVLKFSKEGYIKYTSHLDMLRLFKRSFNRAGLRLAYSQGFNPHPRLSFAQPLSLGYTSIAEYLEFELMDDMEPEAIRAELQKVMPEGIRVTECSRSETGKKSLAARCVSAEYIIAVPVDDSCRLGPESADEFLAQTEIIASKRKKNKKKRKAEYVEINIRPMIKDLSVYKADDKLFLSTTLDAGSSSNLSPELLLNAYMAWAGLPLQRENVEILRTKLICK